MSSMGKGVRQFHENSAYDHCRPCRYMRTLVSEAVSQAGISNYIPTVWCKYWFLPKITACGAKVLMHCGILHFEFPTMWGICVNVPSHYCVIWWRVETINIGNHNRFFTLIQWQVMILMLMKMPSPMSFSACVPGPRAPFTNQWSLAFQI